MASELPERLEMYERRGELRAMLNSKQVPDVRKYAKALKIVTVKVNGTRKIKCDLIDDIIGHAEGNVNRLHNNWLERVDQNKPIWKKASQQQTLKQLRKQADELEIKYDDNYTKTKLISLINQNSVDNKYNCPEDIAQYNPDIEINQKFNRMDVIFKYVPPDETVITELINWYSETNIEHLLGRRLPKNKTVQITTTATATVTSYYKETDSLNRTVNGFWLVHMPRVLCRSKIKVDEIRKWLADCDTLLQKLVASGSDYYAEIDVIEELHITYKIIDAAGKGSVNLKNPEQFPFIFNLEDDSYFLFTCLDNAGAELKEGVTKHDIVQELGTKTLCFSKENRTDIAVL